MFEKTSGSALACPFSPSLQEGKEQKAVSFQLDFHRLYGEALVLPVGILLSALSRRKSAVGVIVSVHRVHRVCVEWGLYIHVLGTSVDVCDV